MEANTRTIERIFDPTIQYQVPLFQRPYVWSADGNLEPLWEDVVSLLDRQVTSAKLHPHFLGAVVFEQLTTATGGVETRQVIDGQQRLTTLQLLLMAARDLAGERKLSKYHQRFSDMVANRSSRIDTDSEACKLWPTNGDRPAFRAIFDAGSHAAVTAALRDSPEIAGSRIVLAYKFFYDRLGRWLSAPEDDDQPTDLETRFEAVWQVAKGYLQLVVIDLSDEDETQVIFETLNARGEELLPADLIKNLLFRKASTEKEVDVERLYEKHWRHFETPFWREEVVQGRIARPRVDVFINHYLTLMTREEVKTSHLFNAFKAYVLADGSEPASKHIEQLARYARVFKELSSPSSHSQLKDFVECLDVVGTTTVYPFLLHAHAELVPDQRASFDRVLELIASFLSRRMMCGLTPKNYNRLFLDLIRACDRAGAVSEQSVAMFLGRATGDSVRFPGNHEVSSALTSYPLYGRLSQSKVRYVLENLDRASYTKKSESQALPSGLSIEHVMPRSWEANWPLPPSLDQVQQQKAKDRRELLLNTLGNLTLVTSSLNPALSNASWAVKRPELLRFSKLNLTQYFHEGRADQWGEAAIEERTKHLGDLLIKIWPDLDVSFRAATSETSQAIVAPTQISSGADWGSRNRELENKLRALYLEHRPAWIAALNGRRFEEKWHVGRAMLGWFLEQGLLTAPEFDALNQMYVRAGKPGYEVEMYRIIWKDAGRSSPEVAAICDAPRRGPSPSDVSDASEREGDGWTAQGVTFPVGTAFRCNHKGATHIASVSHSGLLLGDRLFLSPSAAAEAVTGSAVNGWRFWHCQLPGTGEWRLIDDLRGSTL